MKPIDIFCDLDDFAFLTHEHVRNNMMNYLEHKSSWDRIDNLILGIATNRDVTFLKAVKTLDNSDAKLVEARVFEHGLQYDRFMLTVQPDESLKPWLMAINKDPRFNLNVCTHRGYSVNGERYTKHSLDKHFSDINWKSIHVIGSKEHPSKVAYLEQQGYKHYLLVDDFPIHQTEVIPKNDHLIVWDKHHQFPQFYLQNIARDVLKLNEHINNYIKKLF